MIRWLFILGICAVLAFCGATVPLGKRTFFGHVKAIWSSEPMTDLKDGVKETAKPATEKAKEFVKGGVDAVRKGSGSGSAEHQHQVKFPLTAQLLDEATRFELRSACRDCFFWRGTACAHDWPDEGQRRWPIDAPNPDGTTPTEAAFCKEFELR